MHELRRYLEHSPDHVREELTLCHEDRQLQHRHHHYGFPRELHLDLAGVKSICFIRTGQKVKGEDTAPVFPG